VVNDLGTGVTNKKQAAGLYYRAISAAARNSCRRRSFRVRCTTTRDRGRRGEIPLRTSTAEPRPCGPGGATPGVADAFLAVDDATKEFDQFIPKNRCQRPVRLQRSLYKQKALGFRRAPFAIFPGYG
jgi:hypothetical protein